MITFDKLKIVFPIEAITILDDSKFETTIVNDIVLAKKFYQERPYMLMIKIDYKNFEAVIEFSGKVLGKDYKKLISNETIQQCFDNLNNIGLFTLDVESIMTLGQVVKCDVTKDVLCDNVQTLCSYVRAHIRNFNQFKCSLLKNGNLIIEKNVTSNKCKKRMTIYDKEKEMSRSENKEFMNTYGIDGEFEGLCRFEINLNSKEQIRSALSIQDTSLISVLSSTANPICSFIEQAVYADNKPKKASTSLKNEMRYLFLESCDFDMAKVEAKIRSYDKHGNIKKTIQPFRELYESLENSVDSNIYNEILSQLKS